MFYRQDALSVAQPTVSEHYLWSFSTNPNQDNTHPWTPFFLDTPKRRRSLYDCCPLWSPRSLQYAVRLRPTRTRSFVLFRGKAKTFSGWQGKALLTDRSPSIITIHIVSRSVASLSYWHFRAIRCVTSIENGENDLYRSHTETLQRIKEKQLKWKLITTGNSPGP